MATILRKNTGWTYHVVGDSHFVNIFTINNNDGYDIEVNNIEVALGTCGIGSNTASGETTFYGNGKSINCYLNGGNKNSDTKSVTKVTGITKSKYFDTSSNGRQIIKFSFNDKPIIGNNNSMSFSIKFSGGEGSGLSIPKTHYTNGAPCTGYHLTCSVSKYQPYATPKVSSFNITNAIGLHNKPSIQAHAGENNSGDNTGTTCRWIVNGREYWADFYGKNENIGNSAGYLSDAQHPDRLASPYNFFRPTTAGVGESQEFEVKFKRTHNATNESAEARGTAKTYRLPKIESLTVAPTDVDGAGLINCSWKTNGRKWDEEKDFETYIEFSTDNWKRNKVNSAPAKQGNIDANVNQNGSIQPLSHISASAIRDAAKTNSPVTVQVRARRRSPSASDNPTSLGEVSMVTGTKTIYVQVTPNTPPTGLIFRRNNSSGTIINPGDSICISPQAKYYTPRVYVSWSYGGGGIVDGYRVKTYDDEGNNNGTYNVSSPNITIDAVNKLRRARVNRITIEAYYILREYDEEGHLIRSEKIYGPKLSSSFVMPISMLNKPVILFPSDRSEWINKNYRVLFQLPVDPDYSYFTSSVRNGYVYRDIELKVNGKVFSWNSYKDSYSTSTITYTKKVVINPSLNTGYPSATTYKLQLRVRKMYGFSYAIAEDSWSEWSNEITVNVVPASFSVNVGDKIMASHRNQLTSLCRRMKNTYPIPSGTIQTKDVKRGDIIYASDYVPPYNDILAVRDAVNNYTTYDADRNPVKFPSIPVFVPIVGEYITALAEDNNYPGRNYIALLHNYANLLK